MMQKRIYYVFCALVVIVIFGTAAVCNMCKAGSATTEKTDVGNETFAASDNGSSTESTSKTSDSKSSESSSDETADDDNELPTIKLEIYEGPTYSAADDICFYRIKATVTGKPGPTIKFSKDDSSGAWGPQKVQINIKRGQPYTLTAVAKNSAGEASASLNLSWGCGDENRDPDIKDFVLSSVNIKTGQQYDVTADVSDPDGDSVTYKWTASGGTINNDTANPMKWTAPAAAGSYTITLVAADGKGGDDTMTKPVNVESGIVNLSVPKVIAEGGYIESGGFINSGGCMYAGDTGAPGGGTLGNKPVRGYISYDISSLAGKTIDTAEMTFNLKKSWGAPADFGAMWIATVAWGSEPLILSDYDLGGNPMQSISSATGGSFTVNSANVKTRLQEAINAGKTRFQVRIHWSTLNSDSDNTWDGWEYDQSGVNLNITYH